MKLSTTFSFAVLLSVYVSTHAAEFVPLRSIPPNQFFTKAAAAISLDGTTVVGSGSRLASPFETRDAFRWTATNGALSLQSVPIMDSPETYATAVSDTGSTIIGNLTTNAGAVASNTTPFRWSSTEGMVALQYPTGDFLRSGLAGDVSASGQIIVGAMANENNDSEAYVWTSETGAVGIGDLPGGEFDSAAVGVSADGRVVIGNSSSAMGREAFRWTALTGMTTLGQLPSGLPGFATAISSDGSTIAGWGYLNFDGMVGTEPVAFRWTESNGMQPLGDLPGGEVASFANAVSADGSIVLGTSWALPLDERHNFRAFVWDNSHGMRDLQDVLIEHGLAAELADWQLVEAWGISDDGRSIVGAGINPDGIQEAWLVRLDHPLNIPEPSAFLLGAISLAAFFGGRQRVPGATA